MVKALDFGVRGAGSVTHAENFWKKNMGWQVLHSKMIMREHTICHMPVRESILAFKRNAV